jgi:putative membrane protein
MKLKPHIDSFVRISKFIRRAFDTTAEFAEASKTLAANQGLYNGFLAAGLLWGIAHPNAATGHQIDLFFLICVMVAGIYGGLTVKRSILLIQVLPALIALVAVLASGL